MQSHILMYLVQNFNVYSPSLTQSLSLTISRRLGRDETWNLTVATQLRYGYTRGGETRNKKLHSYISNIGFLYVHGLNTLYISLNLNFFGIRNAARIYFI